MESTVSILIVEDHAIMRAGLKLLLNKENGFSVVGEAGNGAEAVELGKRLCPDIILMDLTLPVMDGVEAIRLLKMDNPHCRVLVLTAHSEDIYIQEALLAGADGYVLKDAGNDEFLLAIHSVLGGKRFLSPAVSESVVRGYLNDLSNTESGLTVAPLENAEPSHATQSTAERVMVQEKESRSMMPMHQINLQQANPQHANSQKAPAFLWSLTKREQEIFYLILDGLKSKDIADRLIISVKTVEKHRSNLMKKLDAHSVSDLHILAQKQENA